MDTNLFRYIWRYSKAGQLWILFVVLVSMPVFLLSYELPKQIVNGPIQGEGFATPDATQPFLRIVIDLPDWLYGGAPLELFSGVPMDRVSYLFALCFSFLAVVCLGGLFKFHINTYKGRLGERMLRRLRYQLVDRLLRFPLPYFRRIKAPEVASMVKDEVEPLGEFIGDALSLPFFQGSQALVALGFIVAQSFWLGLIALVVVLVQAILIPRLRRRLLVLGKERQLTARALAGRVGEIVDGIAEVHVNDTSHYERADIAKRLGRIFSIRFELYQRKFFIKFLNNFLAQFTPFLFYIVGGYFAIRGSLDIGQLVAVIAAYKDLPTPIRELINWDQKRLDVQIKYTQVIEQFDPGNLLDPAVQSPIRDRIAPITGDISAINVGVTDDSGATLIERATFSLPIGQKVAAIGDLNSGAESMSEVLARLLTPTSGRVLVGGQNLSDLPMAMTGRRFAYVGQDTYLYQGSVFDALTYGLKHVPLRQSGQGGLTDWELAEARLSGNTTDDFDSDWIDYEAAGVDGMDGLVNRVIEVLGIVQLDRDVFELGLRGSIDPVSRPDLVENILDARRALRERLREPPLSQLVEPFDPEQYNRQATIAENLLFGTATGTQFDGDHLIDNPYLQSILHDTRLDVALFEMGRKIAATVVELFADLPVDHPFFEQLDFLSAEELPEYEALVSRLSGMDFADVTPVDSIRLMQLSFAYVEPRHRLGLLNDDMRGRILEARHRFHDQLPADLAGAIEFYDPETYNSASSLQDNILFGRIAHGIAEGPARVSQVISGLVKERGLVEAVLDVGLQFNVGTGGKRLTSIQRQKIGLARALLKRPDLLIVNRTLSALDTASQEAILDAVMNDLARDDGRPAALFWTLSNPDHARRFDRVLVFEDGVMVEEGTSAELVREGGRLARLTAAG